MPEISVPDLEMLWESHDPTDVLTTRFGLGDGAAAARWVVATLEELWGVRVDSCERIVMSDCNALAWVKTGSGRMLAKWSVASERFPRLAALARLTAWLDEEGMPVSAPVVALDGRVQVEVDDVSLSVQREVVGDLLDTAVLDQVREAGAVLARLHDVLATYPDADRLPGLVPPAAPLEDKVTEWLDTAPDHVPGRARDVLRRMAVNAASDSLPTQLVHGDFRSANVLCIGSEVAAVIDFEEARLDHRIVELARSAVLLGTRFHDWGPVSSQVRAALLDGYQSVRRLTPVEASWWDILVLWYSLAMIPSGEDRAGWRSAALNQLRELGPDA